MEALFTSTHIPNLQTRPLLKSSLPTSSQSSSCWLCSSLPKRQFSKLRISNGSSHGLRVQALLRNETPSEGEDNMAESSGFDFFSGGVFSLSQVLFFSLFGFVMTTKDYNFCCGYAIIQQKVTILSTRLWF
ncbi:hypothetical protein CARUB_v10014913mg [Capsella rubella]|uniref:Uncharacterized protein n=1 Tax=Capsella rubella TaxID=81985 RepID=R0G7U5_9BRAS|nr:hypothetical protein CARUB_v10014913mg [Capsella rubella]